MLTKHKTSHILCCTKTSTTSLYCDCSQVRHEQDDEVKQLSQLRDSLRTQLQVDGKEVIFKINTTPIMHNF